MRIHTGPLMGFVLLCGADIAHADPADEALAAARKRLGAAVNGCYMSSGAANYAAGRVEIFAQAHATEIVNVVVHSELNNPDFSACVCARSVTALAPWTATVTQDDALTLPYILSPNSGQPGQTYPQSALTCTLNLASAQTPEDAPTALLPGQVRLSAVKAKKGDAAAIQSVLEGAWGEVERCYRADLIRYEGYGTEARLELLLNPDGTVSAARIDGVAHNAISNCQIQHLLGLRFPTTGTAARVKARLDYIPGE